MYITINMAVTMVTVLVAAVTDIRTGKVYNAVTIPVIVLALVLSAAHLGWEGLAQSLQGIGLALGLWLFSNLFGRVMGGGDIKLLAAIGSLQGPRFLLLALACSILIGGGLALVLLLARGATLQCFRRIYSWLFQRVICQAPAELSPQTGGVRLPYAVPIAIGTLVAFLAL